MFRTVLLASVLLLAACGSDDDNPTGPGGGGGGGEPTHYDLTLTMSSILAVRDCDSGSNPGDFVWRLVIRKDDEFGGQVVVHDTGENQVSASDGDRVGITMDDVLFRLPNDPEAGFQVEYWVRETDGTTNSFSNTGWVNHQLDSGRGQVWAAGSSYESDRYTENADGSGSGLMKFSVWNDFSTCSGAAYYYVTWTPVTP